ncbi:S8 family serine peptidase [Streptomyces mirabilis]
MSVRVVVEFASEDWPALAQRLQARGLEVLAPQIPGYAVVLFANDVDAEEAAEAMRSVSGIRNAYPDVRKFSASVQ